MIRTLLSALAVAVLLLAGVPAVAAGPHDDLLKASDIEAAAGLTGVAGLERLSQPWAGGTLNFATAEGAPLLMVQVADASYYDQFHKAYHGGDLTLADAAFSGTIQPASTPNFVAFRKGVTCVTLTVFPDPSGTALPLDLAALVRIAEVVAARL
ncbi:hypothetical protein [Caenispirillum bisanense]|uniref:hypothetical protein n=1 Tax=Caenispirillum bisanense TaxID=414052 RepID=UPI0031D0BEC0